MPDYTDTDLDKRVSDASAKWASEISALAGGPLLRAAILSAAINDLIWTVFHDLPDERDALADALAGMDEAVRHAMREK